VNAIEITFTVPKADKVIEAVCNKLGDSVIVGAGTVLDTETARIAINAGAKFVVSPAIHLPTIEYCKQKNVPVMPGALTPTEIVTAWQAGADVVKIFPSIEATGPQYLKALRGPLPHVLMMPTGGVTLASAAEFLKAGACALGVGSALADPKAIAERKFGEITTLAKKYVEIVKQTRAAMK
jgi:2-dehydro-3-deoxyphosphogluconate aldolase/(4S)-4-hydroxy-2-oxoglutarate aldolase